MKAKTIFIPGIAGTTVMTAFSYLLSQLAKENFSEPEHLGTLIHNLAPQNARKFNRVAGWSTHYAVGILFSLIYVELYEKRYFTPSVKNGLVLGGISGTLAVIVWKLAFKAYPAVSGTNYRDYYLQLFAAHVVFALTATITYNAMVDSRKFATDKDK